MGKADELRELRISRKIPAKDMVAVVQELYPRFDKPMLSKCEHGDECGVSIPDDALDLLYARFAPDLQASIQNRKKDRHKLPCRISARLPEWLYEALQQRMRADGYVSAQNWIYTAVINYIDKGD